MAPRCHHAGPDMRHTLYSTSSSCEPLSRPPCPRELLESPEPQQGAGELDQPTVVGGLLIVADKDRATLGQPGEGALDDPAAGGGAPGTLGGVVLLSSTASVGRVAGAC